MDSDVLTRILAEVATGKVSVIPDDDEMAAMRVQLKIECDEIKAAGYGVDVPHEVPDVS